MKTNSLEMTVGCHPNVNCCMDILLVVSLNISININDYINLLKRNNEKDSYYNL